MKPTWVEKQRQKQRWKRRGKQKGQLKNKQKKGGKAIKKTNIKKIIKEEGPKIKVLAH
jgi:hypothetical protein